MRKFIFKKIDAFTNINSKGNPAGCVYLETPASNDEMQTLANELKGYVNEVVYCLPIKNNIEDIYSLLYYSSECEVEFCGHGTIACMYDLIINNEEIRHKDVIDIRTKNGDLKVYNKILDQDAVFISSPLPKFSIPTITSEDIYKEFEIDLNIIETKNPISIVNAGLNTLIVPITGLSEMVSIWPNINSLKEFCINQKIDIIITYTNEVFYNSNKFHTRVFAPKYGYLEDPATGSGNSALGYYLLKQKLWDGSPMSIEQGPSLSNPNIVKLNTIKNSDNKTQVIFGGKATTRIEGNYFLHI